MKIYGIKYFGTWGVIIKAGPIALKIQRSINQVVFFHKAS